MLESFCREGWDTQLDGAEFVKGLCCSEQVLCSQRFGGWVLIWAKFVISRCLSLQRKTAFKSQKKKIETGHQNSFFPELHCWRMCASEKQASRERPPFLYSCHCSGESHSRAAEIPASDCSLAFDTKVLWCLSQHMSLCLTCLLPRLLLWPATFRDPSSENFRSRMRVKTWNYQMIPSMLSHSCLPPI